MSSKFLLIIGIAIAGGLALYGATQTWVTLLLVSGAAAFDRLDSTGQQLNQSLSPVALAALAAALALTISGKVFRRALGLLVMLLGAGIVAISAAVLRGPESAAIGQLAEATGLTGAVQSTLVTEVITTPFIFLTLCAGAALVLLGLLVLMLGGRWKAAGRKYETTPGPTSLRDDEPDRISDWETMNEGHDPSQRD